MLRSDLDLFKSQYRTKNKLGRDRLIEFFFADSWKSIQAPTSPSFLHPQLYYALAHPHFFMVYPYGVALYHRIYLNCNAFKIKLFALYLIPIYRTYNTPIRKTATTQNH